MDKGKLLGMGTATAALVLGLPALPAGAAGGPDTSGRFLVEAQHIDETYPVEDFCGTGLTVEEHDDVTLRGFFTFRGADSIPYFTGTVHFTTTITEPDGTTVTYTGSNVDKDQRIEVDGDLLTITALGAGGFRVVGPAGQLRDPGMVFYQVVVDSNGTLQDPTDDEFVADLGLLRESTGLNETVDFCADYLTVTGRA
jgi:hypothetical protein